MDSRKETNQSMHQKEGSRSDSSLCLWNGFLSELTCSPLQIDRSGNHVQAELGTVIHWLRQLMGIIVGIIYGVFAIQGATGLLR